MREDRKDETKGEIACKKDQSVHSQSMLSFYYINPFFLNVFPVLFHFLSPCKREKNQPYLSAWTGTPGTKFGSSKQGVGSLGLKLLEEADTLNMPQQLKSKIL